MSLFQTCNASQIDTNTNLDSEYHLDLITDQKPDELGFEEPIRCELIMISSNASPKTLFLPDDVEYRYRVDLFDSNNHAVDKTELGKRIGSEFDSVGMTPKYIRHMGPYTLFSGTTNEIKTRLIRVREAKILPTFQKPSDIFQLYSHGNYRMRLQVQVIESTTNSEVRLVRFPPIEVKVHKP